MIAIFYLLLCVFTGYVVLSYVAPSIFEGNQKTYAGEEYNVSPVFLWLPASMITGILFVTWLVYLLGCIFHNLRKPLVPANIITFIVVIVVDCLMLYMKKKRGQLFRPVVLEKSTVNYILEAVFMILVTSISTWLMFYTFNVKDHDICMGYTVFSDFSPHTSMIRSFSYGNNFPTWYPFYAGEDVKYHFMFQFLAGNLEFLGLRLDYAFNIPSIISLVMVYMLLYVLTVKISGRRIAGFIASLLFTFRCSPSLFTFLKDVPEGESAFEKLRDYREFIGYTPNENWGLWNLNVYVNQRHLPLCMAMMLMVIIIVLPKLYETFKLISEIRESDDRSIKRYFSDIFIGGESWKLGNVGLAIYIGLVMGASGFFNGAVLIALLLILFFIAALSRNRLDFVIMAGIALLLSMIQSKCFMIESSIKPAIYIGFISENKTFWGIADFIIKLVGILAILVVAMFMYYNGPKRYLVFAFLTPFIFSFTISLTVDPNVNHKYIVISCMMIDVMLAGFISELFKKVDFVRYIGAVILIIILTATGVYDLYSVKVKNGEGAEIRVNMDDPVTQWIHENADSRDIFLTSNYTVNRVTMGGAMLYNGWQYFAWSAGYDTWYRDEQTAKMYSATSSEELIELTRLNNIRYIVVDEGNRHSESYELNEEIIKSTFREVYTDGEGDWKLSIYDTK